MSISSGVTLILHETQRYRIVASVHANEISISLFLGPVYQLTKIPAREAWDRLLLRTVLNGIEGTALAETRTRLVDFEQLYKTITTVCRRPS